MYGVSSRNRYLYLQLSPESPNKLSRAPEPWILGTRFSTKETVDTVDTIGSHNSLLCSSETVDVVGEASQNTRAQNTTDEKEPQEMSKLLSKSLRVQEMLIASGD